jgi:hypothetical protein
VNGSTAAAAIRVCRRAQKPARAPTGLDASTRGQMRHASRAGVNGKHSRANAASALGTLGRVGLHENQAMKHIYSCKAILGYRKLTGTGPSCSDRMFLGRSVRCFENY